MQDIDNAPQIVLRADGQMHGNTPGRKLVLDLGERTVEVGTLAVEHVDEEDTSQSELVSDLLHPGVPTSSPITPLTTTSAPSTTRNAQRDSP